SPRRALTPSACAWPRPPPSPTRCTSTTPPAPTCPATSPHQRPAGTRTGRRSRQASPCRPAGRPSPVTRTTSSSVSLSWTAPSGTVSGYYVEEAGTQVATVTGGTTDTVTGLAASTTYTFTVEAYNSGGTSPQSGQLR